MCFKSRVSKMGNLAPFGRLLKLFDGKTFGQIAQIWTQSYFRRRNKNFLVYKFLPLYLNIGWLHSHLLVILRQEVSSLNVCSNSHHVNEPLDSTSLWQVISYQMSIKSCPKVIPLEKWKILTPNNVGNLGEITVATGFEKVPKIQ